MYESIKGIGEHVPEEVEWIGSWANLVKKLISLNKEGKMAGNLLTDYDPDDEYDIKLRLGEVREKVVDAFGAKTVLRWGHNSEEKPYTQRSVDTIFVELNPDFLYPTKLSQLRGLMYLSQVGDEVELIKTRKNRYILIFWWD